MPRSMSDLLDVEIRPGWRLSAERSLFFTNEQTLVVADIHWGYADSHRHAGNLLPLWGNEDLRRRLELLLAHYRPARMIWLGDSLHTRHGAKLAEDFLASISRGIEVIVLAGNHDRTWPRANVSEYRMGNFLFHHGGQATKDRSWLDGDHGTYSPRFWLERWSGPAAESSCPRRRTEPAHFAQLFRLVVRRNMERSARGKRAPLADLTAKNLGRDRAKDVLELVRLAICISSLAGNANSPYFHGKRSERFDLSY